MPPTTGFETALVAQYPNPASRARGLQAGATYKLRRLYLDGVVDPLAHTLAKNHADQVAALTAGGNLATFDALTTP
jgi:hypothetical protein